MTTRTISIEVLRQELKRSVGDTDKLSELHSVVTESINNAYGPEREMLRNFRQEVKDALNSRVPGFP